MKTNVSTVTVDGYISSEEMAVQLHSWQGEGYPVAGRIFSLLYECGVRGRVSGEW